MADINSFSGLIVAGCSFTAGSSDIEYARNTPTTWAHFLLQRNSNFRQFVNLAIPGSSNISSSANLQLLLQQEAYPPYCNLVLFNITGTGRYDVMCEVGHPDANKNFSWNKILDIDWIVTGGFANPRTAFLNTLQKTMGYSSIQKTNFLALMSMMRYLEHRNYTYAFMIMDDDSIKENMPHWFRDFLDQRQHRLIKFDGQNMFEFSKTHNMLSTDKFHPSVEGYRLLSEHIENHIKTL